MTSLDNILKRRDITFLTKVHLVKAVVFPVVVYGCDSWTIKRLSAKNWCFWTVLLEKTLESPLDCKEIKPVHPKGNQSWSWRSSILASWCKEPTHWKSPNSGKDWRQEEKGMTEDEMVGWNHWFHGHEYEQALGDGEGQESLVCCSPWGCEESDMTEWLANNNNRESFIVFSFFAQPWYLPKA